MFCESTLIVCNLERLSKNIDKAFLQNKGTKPTNQTYRVTETGRNSSYLQERLQDSPKPQKHTQSRLSHFSDNLDLLNNVGVTV